MKKLIAMIGAVAMSFGLFAEAFTSSVNDDIQTRELGDSNIVGSGEPDDIHWWDDNFATTGYEQPAVVSNDTTLIENTKYLKVETDSSPLLRTFTPVTTGGDPATYSYGKVDIENHGLFIDTKVRMTGFESDPTPQGDGNKLLVWLKAVTDEDAGGAGYTNLMVTCGFWDGELVTPTNYVVTAAGLDVKPDEWVRLTIRADKDTDDNVAKFKVFVNEKQVTADVEGGELSVFPSLVGSKSTDLSLAAAGFQGNGGINSVGLLTAADAPDFAADPTILTITWNEGVTGFTVGEQKIDVTGNGTTNLVIASDALTDIVVTPTFQQDPQFELKGYTLGGEEQSPEEDGSAKFSMTRYEENLTLAIEAKQSRVGATLFVDGHSLGDYAFVKEAIGALATIGEFNSAKITLAMDEAITDFGDWSELSGDITLDLNGKTVSVDTEKAWAGSQTGISGVGCLIYNNNEANITITNSISDCGQLVGSDNVWLVYNKNGTMSLANANIKYDGNIYSSYATESQFYGQLTIYGGKFKPKAEFYDESNGLAKGLVWGNEDTDGFFPVEEKTTPTSGFMIMISGVPEYFSTLNEAFEALTEDGQTITALSDNEFKPAAMYTIPFSCTLDLAGYNLAGPGGKTFEIVNGKTLTVNATNSTITGVRFNVGKQLKNDGSEWSNGALVLNGGNYSIDNNTIVHVNGSCDNCAVTINDATLTSSNDNGVQFNGKGTYAINRSTIKGATAIYMKGGTLNIDANSVINATAATWTAPVSNRNGSNATGDAIVMDSNTAYKGEIGLIVADGAVVTTTADGAAAIRETITAGDKSTTVTINAPQIASIALTDSFAAKVAAGDASLPGFVAVVNGTPYKTIDAAIAAAGVGSTLKLLADVDIAGTVANAITFDVNGHKATVAESTTLTLNAAVTLENAVPAAGGFLNEGTIAANADLDLSAFAWGQGGLLPTTKTGVKIVIAKDVTVKFAAGNNPNAMETNMTGFLSGSADGALFVNGTDTYTYVAADTKWYIFGATAEIAFAGGVTEAEWTEGGSFPAVTVTPTPAGATYTGSWNAEYPAENPSEDTIFTYTVKFTGEYKGTDVTKTFKVKKVASFPPYIPDDPVIQKKYSDWATEFGVTDPAEAKEDAFLLNCANTDEEIIEAKKAFKFTSIVAGTTPTDSNVTEGYKGKTWNGTVVIKAYETPDCKGDPVDPSGAETKLFYQATLEIK